MFSPCSVGLYSSMFAASFLYACLIINQKSPSPQQLFTCWDCWNCLCCDSWLQRERGQTDPQWSSGTTSCLLLGTVVVSVEPLWPLILQPAGGKEASTNHLPHDIIIIGTFWNPICSSSPSQGETRPELKGHPSILLPLPLLKVLLNVPVCSKSIIYAWYTYPHTRLRVLACVFKCIVTTKGVFCIGW